MSALATSSHGAPVEGRARTSALPLWGLGALLLCSPVALFVWAAFFGSVDTSREGQVVGGVVLVAVTVLIVWLAAHSETFSHPRTRVADSDEKDPVESWASWAWIVSAVSFGLATPIVFFIGAVRAKRPWLVLAGVGSLDLLILSIGLEGGGDHVDTATAVGTTLFILQWLGSTLLVFGVWIAMRTRRRRAVVVATASPADATTWDEYVSAVPAPQNPLGYAPPPNPWAPPAPSDAWGYAPPPAASAPPSSDDVPMERLAVASLVCSIAGLLTGVTALVGVVLGFVARTRIRRSDTPRQGRGLATAGVIVGLADIVVALVVVVAVLAAQPSGDKALALHELLPLNAEFPTWSAQGSDSELTQASFFGGDTGADLAAAAQCVGMTTAGVDAFPVEVPSEAYSPASGNFTVNDTVDVFPTAGEAAKDAAAAAFPVSMKCQSWYTTTDLGPDYGTGETDGAPELLHRTLPPFGHLVADTEVAVPYTYEGSKNTFYDEWVTVLVGRSESNLSFSRDGAPVPAQMIDRLVKDAIKQMDSQGS
jgi:hypothetical protein